ELLGLRFERLARLLEIADGCDQLPIRIEQTLLVALQRRNVGAHGDITAVAGAALVDVKPTTVGELRLEGARPEVLPAVEGVRLHEGSLSRRHRLCALRTRKAIRGQLMEKLVFRVAQNEAMVGVPEDEGFRDRLDGLAQARIG